MPRQGIRTSTRTTGSAITTQAMFRSTVRLAGRQFRVSLLKGRAALRRMATETAEKEAGAGAKGGSEAPKENFFKSEKWTKTVGTIGALANWGIPLAAIMHIVNGKDPLKTINLEMTASLCFYSILFMRWAIAITPANYPLLVCHASNEVVQLVQLYRHIDARYLNPKAPAAGAAGAAAEKKQ